MGPLTLSFEITTTHCYWSTLWRWAYISMVFLTMPIWSWLWETPALRIATMLTNTQSSQWLQPFGRKNYGKRVFPINTFSSLVLCSAAALQSLRQRACRKISYIIGFSSDRLARSSLINISTEPGNGQDSLKLHYVTLPHNKNPIKLDNYLRPIRGGCLCTWAFIFFLSKAASHRAILPFSLPLLSHSFLTACPQSINDTSLVGKGKRVASLGRAADGCLVVNSVAEPKRKYWWQLKTEKYLFYHHQETYNDW